MKNLFSKSLMMAAAAMMFVSCSNEEDVVVNPYEGKTTDVTIGMSVKGVGSKASANEVNLGNKLQTIENILVVPMVGEAFQNPIRFDKLSPAAVTGNKKTEVRTLAQTVNRFKVYGNVLDKYVDNKYSTITETQVFPGLNFTAPELGEEATKPETGSYCEPHGLYYYFDTKDNGYNATVSENWNNVTWDTSNEVAAGTAIGNNNCIYLGPVHYEVGVLAAAIKNGDNETTFYSENPGPDSSKPTTTGAEWTGDEVEVSGVIVYDQTKAFNSDFTGTDKVNVYEEADVTTLSTNSISSTANKDKGNIYCVVTETAADDKVTLNIEFTANAYFYLANGTLVSPNDKFYLPVVLDKKMATDTSSAANSVFQKDYATYLNATVKNWGLASENPVESTDVTIGVDFDLDWGAGLQFDLDI